MTLREVNHIFQSVCWAHIINRCVCVFFSRRSLRLVKVSNYYHHFDGLLQIKMHLIMLLANR